MLNAKQIQKCLPETPPFANLENELDDIFKNCQENASKTTVIPSSESIHPSSPFDLEADLRAALRSTLETQLVGFVSQTVERTVQEFVVAPYNELLDDYLDRQEKEVELFETRLDRVGT